MKDSKRASRATKQVRNNMKMYFSRGNVKESRRQERGKGEGQGHVESSLRDSQKSPTMVIKPLGDWRTRNSTTK